MESISLYKLIDNYGQVTCETNWRWNTLAQPLVDYDLWYVWSGEGSMTLNGTEYQLTKGSCFLFRPGDRTSAVHNPEKPLTVTYLHYEVGESEMEKQMPVSYRKLQDMLTFEVLLSRYVYVLIEKSYQYETEAKLLLSLMLQQLLREKWKVSSGCIDGEYTHAIYEVANYIRQHPGIRHNIGHLAARAGLSSRYFSLKFKEIMQLTVEDFMILMRIQRAEHLLRHNNWPVSEVADALGYKNVYFFSRQFKKFNGRTPSQVRHRM